MSRTFPVRRELPRTSKSCSASANAWSLEFLVAAERYSLPTPGGSCLALLESSTYGDDIVAKATLMSMRLPEPLQG